VLAKTLVACKQVEKRAFPPVRLNIWRSPSPGTEFREFFPNISSCSRTDVVAFAGYSCWLLYFNPFLLLQILLFNPRFFTLFKYLIVQ
jgi:hypothetical protein